MSSEARFPPVGSLTEFLEAVLSLAEEGTVLLRGHRCGGWRLAPKLARLDLRPTRHYRDAERHLVERFKAQCLPHLQRELRDEWDVLALAQHHGLATRLLDWTSNPLVALWFAVREPAMGHAPGSVHIFVADDDDFADKASGEPYGVPRTLFFRPSHLTQRIVVQDGWFSVHKYNTRTRRFSTLEKVKAYQTRVGSIVIPNDLFPRLRAELAQVGITYASMFPGLDGLSSHLNWQVSLLPDEVSEAVADAE